MSKDQQKPSLVFKTQIESILYSYSGQLAKELIYQAAKELAIAKVEEQRVIAIAEFNRQMKLDRIEQERLPNSKKHFFDVYLKYPKFE